MFCCGCRVFSCVCLWLCVVVAYCVCVTVHVLCCWYACLLMFIIVDGAVYVGVGCARLLVRLVCVFGWRAHVVCLMSLVLLTLVMWFVYVLVYCVVLLS